MRLVLVELGRFRSRRAIALMLLAATLLTGLVAASTVWGTRPVSRAEMAQARVQADREAASPAMQRELRRCQQHPARYMGSGHSSGDCARMMMPRPDWYLTRQTLSLEEVRDGAGLGALTLVAALMVIVGTSFAGADWATGSMSNQLLFEPRRSKVWAAKGAAVFTGTLVASAAILVAFWAVMFLVADARGITTGAAVQESIRAMVGRGVLLSACGALGAFALTMLLRHTVGTVAVLFAYAVGGTAVLAALPISGAGRWSVGNNVLAWLSAGYDYQDSTIQCGPGCASMTVHMTLGQGASYLGVVLAVVMTGSLLAFRRRDVP